MLDAATGMLHSMQAPEDDVEFVHNVGSVRAVCCLMSRLGSGVKTNLQAGDRYERCLKSSAMNDSPRQLLAAFNRTINLKKHTRFFSLCKNKHNHLYHQAKHFRPDHCTRMRPSSLVKVFSPARGVPVTAHSRAAERRAHWPSQQ